MPVRKRLALLVPTVFLAIPLVLPAGAAGKIENVTLSIDNEVRVMTISASSGNDDITIRRVRGIADPTKSFFEIEDLGGVAVVPPGCFRRDANAIHCPEQLVEFIEIFAGAGNDRVTNETEVPVDTDGNLGDDVIDGDGDDISRGGPGNDKLIGQGGDDRLLGGPGKDTLFGGQGNDRMFGGAGVDRFSGGPGRDFARGGGGNDRGSGGPGDDNFRD